MEDRAHVCRQIAHLREQIASQTTRLHIVPFCVPLPLNMFVEDLSSAVFFHLFSRPACFIVSSGGAQPDGLCPEVNMW